MSEIKQALTAEEWERGYLLGRNVGAAFGSGSVCVGEDMAIPEDAHAVAAACLYGQPFGFTREDVWLMRSVVEAFAYYDRHGDGNRDPALKNLADRIEALLPPEK